MLNLPPKWRFCFGAMLVFMVVPPKTKNFNGLLYVLLQKYGEYFTNARTQGQGFRVYDASTRTSYNMRFELVLDIEDTQGLKNALLCKSPGAKIGGCFMCRVIGLTY